MSNHPPRGERVRGVLPGRGVDADRRRRPRGGAGTGQGLSGGALAGYAERCAAIPVASQVLDWQEVAAFDPARVAKLELYSALRDQGITKRALAERLGLSDTTVGRLTDPDRHSRIEYVTRALRGSGGAS